MNGPAPVDRQGRKQEILDRFLSLYLFNEVSERSRMWGIMKFMKLIFLSEKKMVEAQKEGFNHRFFRYDKGPLSTEVYTDYEVLQEQQLITDNGYYISDRGREVLEESSELIEENRSIFEEIDEVVEAFGGFSGSQLKNIVYDVEVDRLPTGETIKVRDIPKNHDIIYRLPDELIREKFEIDEGWIDTLEIMMDQEARENLEGAMSDAKTQSSIELDI